MVGQPLCGSLDSGVVRLWKSQATRFVKTMGQSLFRELFLEEGHSYVGWLGLVLRMLQIHRTELPNHAWPNDSALLRLLQSACQDLLDQQDAPWPGDKAVVDAARWPLLCDEDYDRVGPWLALVACRQHTACELNFTISRTKLPRLIQGFGHAAKLYRLQECWNTIPDRNNPAVLWLVASAPDGRGARAYARVELTD